MEKRNDFGLISQYRTPIMGFAALWIYVFHEWEQIFDNYPQLFEIEQFIKRIGFSGVDIFFFLSGLGLIYAIEKYNTQTFLKRRLERVVIPYCVTALAMMLANEWTAEVFWKKLLGYDFLFVNIYSLLWFVPAIVILYLLFPAYYRLFKKTGSKIQFTTASLLIWLQLTLFLQGTMRYDLYGFTNRIPVFLIGVLVGWIIREREVVFTRVTWLIWILILGLGLYFAQKTNFEGLYLVVPASNCCIPNLLIAVSGCCLLSKLFSWLDRIRPGRWVLKFFGFFGKRSLELYCTQEWIGGEVRSRMADCGDLKTNAVAFLFVLAATLVLHAVCRLIGMVIDRLGALRKKA